MNRIHIISGTAIVTIALLLVTAMMSDQQADGISHMKATIITVMIIIIVIIVVAVQPYAAAAGDSTGLQQQGRRWQ